MHVNSSSPLSFNSVAENVLDGSTGRTPDEGSKCFASQDGETGWLTLNLGSQYLVAQIAIRGRIDGIVLLFKVKTVNNLLIFANNVKQEGKVKNCINS